MKDKSTSMTFDEILQNSELTHIHEVAHFLESTKDINLLQKK